MQDSLNTVFQKQSLVFNRGVERETLRVDSAGNLATTSHPDFLGSKLCHPTITTDFSEVQLELITPVSQSIDQTLTTLNDTHRFVHSGLEDEVLWSASMPCALPDDKAIPLAEYGSSNLAKLKTTYRNGLGNRYGRSMQTICAVHYNFSFCDSLWQDLAHQEGVQNTATYRTRRYFDVMRNFRRMSWLPVYLFGASPAVCNSFAKGRKHNLEKFDEASLYLPDATSLRNGNLGYQSDAQSDLLNICYNSLENYVGHLVHAITSPYIDYSNIATKSDDLYPQLNDSIIQSEAEFYTTIRAKCVPASGANFLETLLEDGVEYIEIRLLDVNPYAPLGIDEHTMRFLDTLLLYCLLIDSPQHDEILCNSVETNVAEIVRQGRHADTRLNDQGQERLASAWGTEILGDLARLATQLDTISDDKQHYASIQLQQQKITDPNLTPSGQILRDMQTHSIPYSTFAMNKALDHQALFLSQPLSADETHYFEQLAKKSFVSQAQIEQQEQINFDAYLENLKQQYLALRS